MIWGVKGYIDTAYSSSRFCALFQPLAARVLEFSSATVFFFIPQRNSPWWEHAASYPRLVERSNTPPPAILVSAVFPCNGSLQEVSLS